MRRVSIALALVGILCGRAASDAAECPGNPNAIGTSRVIAVDATEHTAVGTMQYSETLPLADKEIVLTFDDGPFPSTSSPILDILASECVKATYFILGRSARAFPDGVRRAYTKGHTLGTHSQTHPMPFDQLPVADIQREIDQGIASTAIAVGNSKAVAPFFRIPGLATSPSVESILRARGLMTWSADFDADDWKGVPAREILDIALKRIEAARKGVLLLHDTLPATVQALPLLLKELKARDYRIVHVVPTDVERPKTVTSPQDWIVTR
jgi:peptidoglycan-N-acetylglucosamine deacetylase